jgi:hypothetical protein
LTEEKSRPAARPPGELLAEGASRVETDEDPSTDSLSDIARQVSFYRELLSFEREVLEQMRRLAASHPDEVRRAVERSNIEPMEALIEQFGQRLSFWQQREREVSPD